MLQQDHEHVEETEGHSRHDEEVDGDEVKDVVLEERSPGLRGPLPAPRRQTCNRALRNVEPQLEQFAVDARRAPERIGERHGADELRKFGADGRSTRSPASGLPGPESAKALGTLRSSVARREPLVQCYDRVLAKDNTTATLLLKAKVPLATVQRILRHSDPRLTSEVYGHLDLDDMREGLKALDFGPLPERAPAPVLPLRKGPSSATFATHLLPAASIPKAENPDRSPNPETTRGVGLVGETGFEPATPWSRTATGELRRDRTVWHRLASTRHRGRW